MELDYIGYMTKIHLEVDFCHIYTTTSQTQLPEQTQLGSW